MSACPKKNSLPNRSLRTTLGTSLPETAKQYDCCRFGECEPAPAEGIVYHLIGANEYDVEVTDAEKFREAHGDRTPDEVAQIHAEVMDSYWREIGAEPDGGE